MSVRFDQRVNRVQVRSPREPNGSNRSTPGAVRPVSPFPNGIPGLFDSISSRFGAGFPSSRSCQRPRPETGAVLDNCMQPLTQKEAALRGRIGGYRLHATHDSREIAARARAGFEKRFLEEVDPDGILPEPERLRRAECARKAHFQRLALKSADARRKKAEKHTRMAEKTAAQAADTEPDA